MDEYGGNEREQMLSKRAPRSAINGRAAAEESVRGVYEGIHGIVEEIGRQVQSRAWEFLGYGNWDEMRFARYGGLAHVASSQIPQYFDPATGMTDLIAGGSGQRESDEREIIEKWIGHYGWQLGQDIDCLTELQAAYADHGPDNVAKALHLLRDVVPERKKLHAWLATGVVEFLGRHDAAKLTRLIYILDRNGDEIEMEVRDRGEHHGNGLIISTDVISQVICHYYNKGLMAKNRVQSDRCPECTANGHDGGLTVPVNTDGGA